LALRRFVGKNEEIVEVSVQMDETFEIIPHSFTPNAVIGDNNYKVIPFDVEISLLRMPHNVSYV
jgi:hypothetical protein